jgi:hypothetical protein
MELFTNHKPVKMITKKHFPAIIGTVLILSLALLSCSTAKKSAVACPEFSNNRYSKVSMDHKMNGNRIFTAHNNADKNRLHIRTSGRNHKDNNLGFSNTSQSYIVRVPGVESTAYINEIEYTESLTASADNTIIPSGRISSAEYLINTPKQAGKSDKLYITQLPGCDTLVLRSGSVLLGKVEEIGQSEIRYKKCDNLNGPVISLAKSDVVQIKFVNGTREVIISDNPGIMPVYVPRPPQDNMPPKMEGLGLTGFIASLVGLFIAGIPLGLLGIIFGGISLSRIKRNPARYRGRGIAIASIIIGFVAIVGAIVVLAMM